jgi:hypothetical protein
MSRCAGRLRSLCYRGWVLQRSGVTEVGLVGREMKKPLTDA